jgi:hypothetical protein
MRNSGSNTDSAARASGDQQGGKEDTVNDMRRVRGGGINTSEVEVLFGVVATGLPEET